MNFDQVHLQLRREKYSSQATLGRLFLTGTGLFWYTLEDTNRDINFDGKLDSPKVYGQTAIPFGVYAVEIRYSPHFMKDMPYLCDVPGFNSIMIHPGNKTEDTLGCILVGKTMNNSIPDYKIGNSQKAFSELFAILKQAKEITISIEDGSHGKNAEN